VRPEGLDKLERKKKFMSSGLETAGKLKKNAVTLSGLEPATLRLVACASSNYATACPIINRVGLENE
jgi:hypothetical protein